MLAEPSEVTHRWEHTHTCLFTPRSKLRRLCCPLLNSKYSRRDSISIYKEIKYPFVTISCQTSDKVKGSYRKNTGADSPSASDTVQLSLTCTCSGPCVGRQTRMSTANHLFLSVLNAMSPCLCNDLLLKQISRPGNPKPAMFSFPSHVPVKFAKCGHFQLRGPCRTFLYSSHNCLTKTL